MKRKERKALPDHFPYEDEAAAASGCIGILVAIVACAIFWVLVT